MKFKTVYEGQQAVVLNHRGEGTHLVGPRRVFLFRERFQRLKAITATENEYIEIQDRSGEIFHKPGPCQVFMDPLEHSSCVKREAVELDANHLMVVYRRLKSGEAQRRIIEGPAVFLPDAEEWVHEFVWHGTDPKNKTRMVPGLNKFTQLPMIPSNFYYNVRDVRTNDDSTITVKLMLFYSMNDVLNMLDTTHDPIADLINALCADVISFVGPLSYGQFVFKTESLSDLKTYPQLLQRAKRIGFNIEKVVYRGYHASEQLQAMQNEAIESRTQLRLEREIGEQKQEITNLILKRQQARSDEEQDMASKKQAHAQTIALLKQQHKLQMDEMRLKQGIELQSQQAQLSLKLKEAEDCHKYEHLKSLSEIGVHLNRYLSLQSESQPAEEIRVLPTIPASQDGQARATDL